MDGSWGMRVLRPSFVGKWGGVGAGVRKKNLLLLKCYGPPTHPLPGLETEPGTWEPGRGPPWSLCRSSLILCFTFQYTDQHLLSNSLPLFWIWTK